MALHRLITLGMYWCFWIYTLLIFMQSFCCFLKVSFALRNCFYQGVLVIYRKIISLTVLISIVISHYLQLMKIVIKLRWRLCVELGLKIIIHHIRILNKHSNLLSGKAYRSLQTWWWFWRSDWENGRVEIKICRIINMS
jgi:hypothetical protein